MPLVLADRVRDTTTTTGTGTITLSGTAPTGYQNFSVIGNGNTTYYTINAGSQWEVGIGTYSDAGPTLARTTVLESSNGGALVNFSAGVKDVFVTYPSDKVIIQDASGNVGVGTASPATRLDVTNGGASGDTIWATGGGNTQARFIQSSSTGYLAIGARSSTLSMVGAFRSDAPFVANLTLNPDGGNVGIGTTSPGTIFDVSYAGNMARFGSGSGNNLLQLNSAQSMGLWAGGENRIYSTSGFRFAINASVGTGIPTGYTDAMTLDGGGRLILGGTADFGGATLQVGKSNSTGLDAGIRVSNNVDTSLMLGIVASAVSGIYSSGALAFGTGSNTFTERMRIDSSGPVIAYVDIRAPIFYDSDNTAFYVDPTSNSHLLELRIGTSAGATNQTGIIKEAGATYGLGLFTWGDVAPIQIGGGSVTFAKEGGAAISVTSVGDFRAPIFYDSNNTGYYIDGAATSQLFTLQIASGFGSFDSVNDPYGKVSVTRNTDANYAYYGLTRAGQMVYQMGIDTSNRFWIGGGTGGYNGVRTDTYLSFSTTGDVTAKGDFRAPIFYDSNNTGYYVDGASHSYLNTLGLLGGLSVLYNNPADRVDGAPWYGIGGMSDNQRVQVAGYYGLRLRSASAIVDLAGDFAQANGSFRAPIFYDSNDTNYYLDPASTSRLNLVAGTLMGAVSGAPDATIWCVSGEYQNWGIFYNESSPDFIEYRYAGITTTAIGLDGGGVRTDIFYDINNTNFYLDPNNTSVLNTVNLSRINMANSNSVYADGDANAGWRFGGTGYVYFNQASPSYFETSIVARSGVRNDSAALLTLQGGTSGGTQINTDTRSPIYYDSNNTAFYIDPNQTSNINALVASVGTFTNNAFSRVLYLKGSGNIIQFQDADGTDRWENVGRNGIYYVFKNYGTGSGFKWSIDDSGNHTFNGIATFNTDVRSPIFYDSNNTGFYVDPTGTSIMADAVIAGRAMNSAMYYAGFTLDANTMPTNSTGFTYQNNAPYFGPVARFSTGGSYDLWLNAPYTGGAGLAFRTRDGDNATLNPWRNIAVYGQSLNASDLRATIYYDSDNTAFYTDPASTSVMASIILQNNNNLTWGNVYGALVPTIAATTGSGIFFYPTGSSSGASFQMFAAHAVATDMRAGIFYDSNNTGFYTDPASTSVMSIVRTDTIQASSGNTAISLGNTWNQFCDPNGATKLWLGGSSDPNNYYNAGIHYFRNTSSATTMTIDASGIVVATAQMRAPIYYDSNNTGYYVDPSETSKTWRMGANYFQSNDPVSADTPFGLYFDSGLSSAYAIFRESGAWTFPFPDLRIAFHTGIKLGANASYQGIRFYTDYDMVTQVMSVNNGDDPLGGGNVFVNNSLQAGSSLRAAIFYDSQDTSYYADPHQTSRFSYLTVVNNAALTSLETGGVGRSTPLTVIGGNIGSTLPSWFNAQLEMRNTDAGWVGIAFHRSGYTSASLFSTGNNLQSNNAFFAPIYYDYDNSAFYLDPSSTGTSLNVAGTIVAAGNVTAYSDIRVKDNVEQIGGALDRVQAIRGVTYTRNDLEDKERRYAGVIAQEIEQVLPEAVFDNGDRKAVDYNATIGLLIEAIKELRAEVAELKGK